MGPEQKRLMDRLFNDPNRKLVNFSITPGEQRVSAEELCAEINKALDDIESGCVEEVFCVDSGTVPMKVSDWLENRGLD